MNLKTNDNTKEKATMGTIEQMDLAGTFISAADMQTTINTLLTRGNLSDDEAEKLHEIKTTLDVLVSELGEVCKNFSL